jgi:hypothetical protein
VVESIIPILDEIVSDYSGKDQAYALSIRFSVGQFGMIVIVMVAPALYNINSSLIAPFWFMLGLVGFGFILAFVVIAYDSKAGSKV